VPVTQAPVQQGADGFKSFPAPLPENAPKDFADAFKRAAAANKPLVIDFWAPWCAPCMRLKKETLADPKVAKALEGFEVILVNLDQHPELAKAYGVNSIPDVFFVDVAGRVVDRLKAFEAPGPFLDRLRKFTTQSDQQATLGVDTEAPSEAVAKAQGLKHKVRLHGRVVTEVAAEGAAARAGVRIGDVLLRLGDNDLYSADDISDFLEVSDPLDQVILRFKRPGEAEPREATVTLGARRSVTRSTSRDVPASGPRFTWQFASLGQLPKALDAARSQHKKLLVGLSGAET
jgi:thioredoxin